MLGIFGLKGLLYAGVAVALWFTYGWGVQVIKTYNDNIAKIERLERNERLLDSRLTSKDTLIERYKAAIDQSQCKTRIQYLLKNPDLLKKPEPFNGNFGG